MDKNYYIEYEELERTNWWFRARQEILRTQVQKIANGNKQLSILNVGVATGASSLMLAEFGKVKSIEFDKDCFEFIKEKMLLDIEQGSILALRFEANSFDLVCAFDVIEHVDDDTLATAELMRVCKPGGSVLVTVPAFMSLFSQHDVINHHFRRYEMQQLKKLFAKQGKIVFFSYFNFILFVPIYIVRRLSKLFPNMFKRKGSGSDFGMMQSKFLGAIFYKMFIAENSLLKKHKQFPFGVSALLLWKK